MENIQYKNESIEYKFKTIEHKCIIYNIKITFLQYCDVTPAINMSICYFVFQHYSFIIID